MSEQLFTDEAMKIMSEVTGKEITEETINNYLDKTFKSFSKEEKKKLKEFSEIVRK